MIYPPQSSVDVRDVTRLHVFALLEPNFQNERLYAIAETLNYSRIVDTLQEVAS